MTKFSGVLLSAGIVHLVVSCSGHTGGDKTMGGQGGNALGGSAPGEGGGGAAGAANTSASGGTSAADPGPVDSKVQPGSCGLAAPAFCETFETPQPGGRGGDLDEKIWSFARWDHVVQYLWVRLPASTDATRVFPPTFCGQTFQNLLPDEDVRVCNGAGVDGTISHQLNEVLDDQHDFAVNSMRIRQPFDFTGRTGTIVFDVDAKVDPLNTGHGWWIEFWITADPAPIPYHDAPTIASLPRQGVGFAMQFGSDCPDITADRANRSADAKSFVSWDNALETIHVADDYTFIHDYPHWEVEEQPARCFKVADAHLNHFELRLSKSRAELWASDFDNPGSLQLRTAVSNLDLTFERGYVHLQHAQYNATKDGLDGCNSGTGDLTKCPTEVQTFRWDNVGFDGPTYPTPRAYDVQEEHTPSAGGVMVGWYIDDKLPHAFTVTDVDLTDALSASFNFNVMLDQGTDLDYRFNGNAWHTFTIPVRAGTVKSGLRTFSLDAPLKELIAGSNKIEVRALNAQQASGIGNMDLTVEVPR